MSNIRNMIDAISAENFDGARGALKASLAEYMAGRKYVSNEEVFGDDYTNPNDEEQELKAELSESDMVEEQCECMDCTETFSPSEKENDACPYCGSGDLACNGEED